MARLPSGSSRRATLHLTSSSPTQLRAHLPLAVPAMDLERRRVLPAVVQPDVWHSYDLSPLFSELPQNAGGDCSGPMGGPGHDFVRRSLSGSGARSSTTACAAPLRVGAGLKPAHRTSGPRAVDHGLVWGGWREAARAQSPLSPSLIVALTVRPASRPVR